MTMTGITSPDPQGVWATPGPPGPPSSRRPQWNSPRDTPGQRAESRRSSGPLCSSSNCPGAPDKPPRSTEPTGFFSSFVAVRLVQFDLHLRLHVGGHLLAPRVVKGEKVRVGMDVEHAV